MEYLKKKIINEHNSINFDISLNENNISRNVNNILQKNKNAKTTRNSSIIKDEEFKNLTCNKNIQLEEKFDLNKYKINPIIENPNIKNAQTAKNKIRNVEKFLLKNENEINKNKNNLINKKNNNITKFDIQNLDNDNIKIEDEKFFEEEKQKINNELNEILDNDEEESPLTLDIIQSIKPRNPIP